MADRSSNTNKLSSGPLFPAFLLPSLSIPFRRRRTSSSISSSPPHDSSPPSLSSSLSSSSPASPASPNSPGTAFLADWDLSRFLRPKAPPLPTAGRAHRRLSRTHPDTLRCSTCSADLAFGAQVVSKGFTGRHGRAYLVSPPAAALTIAGHHPPATTTGTELANIRIGRSESRPLATGMHVVADISCAVCGARLGWKYVDALEAAQKYKVGKFILETRRVVACRDWEDVEDGDGDGDGPAEGVVPGRRGRRADSLEVEMEQVDGGGSDGGEEGDDDGGAVVFDSEDEQECEDIFAGTWDPVVVAKRRRGKVANLRKRGGMRRPHET